ncbi:MAG: DUF3465 domain-containing protein, partial [Planctomycetota bacterium]
MSIVPTARGGRRRFDSKRALVVLLVALAVYAYTRVKETERRAEGEVADLFRAQRSGVMVELEAEVVKVLGDDREGARHQRFLLAVGSDLTVLVAHNIDLAPRV